MNGRNGSSKGAKETPRRTVPLSAVRSVLNASPAASSHSRKRVVRDHNQLIRIRTLICRAAYGGGNRINCHRPVPVHFTGNVSESVRCRRPSQASHRVNTSRVARYRIGLPKIESRSQCVSKLPGIPDQYPFLQIRQYPRPHPPEHHPLRRLRRASPHSQTRARMDSKPDRLYSLQASWKILEEWRSGWWRQTKMSATHRQCRLDKRY